jgi:hypothetical protein
MTEKIRFYQRRSTVGRGAPCSPQRTWAENGVFECLYSIPELFSQEQFCLRARQERCCEELLLFKRSSPLSIQGKVVPVHDDTHRHSLREMHAGNLQRAEEVRAGCGSVRGDRDPEVLPWRHRAVLPQRHRGDPVRRPENTPAAAGSKAPAADESSRQVQREATMLRPQTVFS